MAEREGPCPGHLLFPPASPGHCRHPPFPPMEGGDGTLGCLGVSPSMGTPWDALRGHWHMRRVRGSQLGGLQGVQRGGEPIPAVPRGGSPSSGGFSAPTGCKNHPRGLKEQPLTLHQHRGGVTALPGVSPACSGVSHAAHGTMGTRAATATAPNPPPLSPATPADPFCSVCCAPASDRHHGV